MADIVDIKDLRKQFMEKVTVEDWKSFAEAQHTIIENYNRQIEILKDKNKHLETLLMKKPVQSLITELSSEEKICIEQIDRLERQSAERQLTLEEVKRLDLLVKNLKLIREESTIVVNNRADALKESELVAIAVRPESD